MRALSEIEAAEAALESGRRAPQGLLRVSVPYLRNGDLVELPLGKRRFGVDAYAVWQQTQHLPSKVRVAVDDLAARIPQILDTAQGLPASRRRRR